MERWAAFGGGCFWSSIIHSILWGVESRAHKGRVVRETFTKAKWDAVVAVVVGWNASDVYSEMDFERPVTKVAGLTHCCKKGKASGGIVGLLTLCISAARKCTNLFCLLTSGLRRQWECVALCTLTSAACGQLAPTFLANIGPFL